MELYKNTTEHFVNYLKKHGYPDNNIVFEWGKTNCAIDIAILSEDYRTPIAIFEVKSEKNERSISNGIMQMRRACNELNLSVPVSLVFGKKDPPYFEVYDISDIIYRDEKVIISDFLNDKNTTEPISYRNIQSSSIGKQIKKHYEDKEKRIDKLKTVCWLILPLALILLMFLDAKGIYIFNTERLIVIGTIILIVLIPFFSEITFKDISLKRIVKDTKKNTK